MRDLNIQVPLNVVSFGQVSVTILREFFKKGYQPCLFPIGPIELQSQQIDQEFGTWIQSCLNKSIKYYKRDNPLFKLWHLHDAMNSVSLKQTLYTFYELDSPTDEEINIASNIDSLVFSSNHAKRVFEDSGVTNCTNIPLGFDVSNFKKTSEANFTDGRIIFNVVGKLERRKHHHKLIRAWLKKYGNDKRYYLQCAIWNPFFKPEELQHYYNQILDGKQYFNIEFHPFFGSNYDYNQFLNSGHIVLGMSGGEGWGLPEFHSVGIGKHAVIHACSSYLDWANEENSILIKPNGKVPAYDGKFFAQGNFFNQGNIFTFDDDEFLNGCDLAIERYKNNPINWAGLKLQQEFTYEKTVSELEKIIFK